jgi:hypothetical protein
MDSQTINTESIQTTATQTVESQLKIRDFIELHSDEILTALEKSAEKVDEEVEFLADAFPIVASVIHVGSRRDDYIKALEWAEGKLATSDKSDADSAITALTFLYLVHRGLAERSGDSAKSELWKKIKNRVDALLEQDAGNEE